ncbi:restriction endonuclease subunit S, partial [Escherichia coli]|nr:restriction endonuclease subunit S [Escherichia coli]
MLPLYGYYALRYHAEEIRKLSNQTTMALISRKTLGQYRIYVPDSLEKQQEIVDKLRRFEEIKLKKEEMRSRME